MIRALASVITLILAIDFGALAFKYGGWTGIVCGIISGSTAALTIILIERKENK